MQNKQTLYISTYDDIKNPNYGGGGAIAVHEVAKRLSKSFDIHVLSWDYSGKKKETIDSIHYERFGYSFLPPKIAMFAYQISLPFIMLSKNHDIWIESFCPPFTTAFLPVFTKKPVIGIVHMLAAEDMERKYKLPFHLIQNSGIKKYKNIIVTSEALKKKVQKINSSSHITVISNGINKVFKPKNKKLKYVLFLGRIEVNQKGIDLLIQAFKRFHLANKDYKLIIAGSGDSKEMTRTQQLIKENSLQKNVVLKGKVSGRTKASLLQNTACLVISSRFETYSLVALEAMANGTPIIHFAIEGLKWVPEAISQKVRAYDVAGLSKALSSVVSNSKHSNFMIKEGHAYAKQFTWDSIAIQYQKYIKSVTK